MGIAEISSCLTLLSMKIQEEIERLKSKLDGIDSSELLLAIHQLIEDTPQGPTWFQNLNPHTKSVPIFLELH